MNDSTKAASLPEPLTPARTHALQLVAATAIVIVALAYTVNLSMPWESDQVPKAAQIIEIANRHDYLLSSDLPDTYRLRLFPLYYSVSGLLYSAIGGNVFAFMNLSSVVIGAAAGIFFVEALRRAFGVGPVWSAITIVAMPLFVITFSYGNEVAWSMAFFFLSLALVASPSVWQHYAGGVAVAAALSCRADILLLAPYWLAWTALYCRTPQPEPWFKRLLRPSAAFILAEALLWVALVRQVPEGDASFGFGWNPLLIVAYLVYPFNPSVVLLGAVGWALLLRKYRAYAICHLLLLIPFAFYARNLASPKYLASLMLFYGLPTAWLLNLARPGMRAAMLALIGLWAMFGISNYGVFGPNRASVWYLPTADGPCPVGGYLHFYSKARQGEYQVKQVSHVAQFAALVKSAPHLDGPYRIIGIWPSSVVPYFRALEQLGTPEQRDRLEQIFRATLTPEDSPPLETRSLAVLSGYTDLAHMNDALAEKTREWLRRGQLRPLDPTATDPLPTWIELGDHIPENENAELGQRLLFATKHDQEQMIFELPSFVADYRSTTWLPAEAAALLKGAPEPIYRDEEFVAFDKSIDGGKTYGFVWPAKYFRMKSPRVKHPDATQATAEKQQ
jgi:hypothetical protein